MKIDKPIVEQLRLFLKDKGLKWTAERYRVLEEVRNSHEHLEADEILFRLKKKDSKISRATVYRSLELLSESGFIQKITFQNKGYYEYALGITHHDHMLCLSCGKVIEFHDPIIEDHQKTVTRKYKFTMTGHNHQIYGYCSDRCKKNGFRRLQSVHI